MQINPPLNFSNVGVRLTCTPVTRYNHGANLTEVGLRITQEKELLNATN